MIDYERLREQNKCDFYRTPIPLAQRFNNSQVLRKGHPYIYGNYYSCDVYQKPEVDSPVYHELVNSKNCRRDDWKNKAISDWNDDDTVIWLIDTVQHTGFSEYDVPLYNFRIQGSELKVMKREDFLCRMATKNNDSVSRNRLVDEVYENLQNRINAEIYRNRIPPRCEAFDPDKHSNSLNHKNRLNASDYRPNDNSLQETTYDSNDDADDVYYSSNDSKSGDEDDKLKAIKKPRGRPPKDSSEKVVRPPKSVSVPEFLRNLLQDPRYNPSIIKWQDYAQRKFKFVKPAEVAKLWGQRKQNESMTFDKFSRAMRYHYNQEVLMPVVARLVYQFGPKGPIPCDSPMMQIKSEEDTKL